MEGRASSYDLTVSCVLYGTPITEVVRLILQIAAIPLSCHLYLIDNSETPLDIPVDDPMAVTIIRPGRNLGYGRANNLAIRASAGASRYHLVINSDLTVAGPDVAKLVAFMDTRPEVGLVSPRVCYPDGQVQHLCRLLPTPLDLLGRRAFQNSAWARRRNQRYEFRDWSYDTVASFPFLSGCFMLLRRTELEKVGGFDERYFLFAEDMDLSRRLHAVSETLFVPDVTIQHEYRSRAAPSVKLLRYLVVSIARYFSKWGWAVDRDRDAINARCLSQFPQLIRTREGKGDP